MMDILLIPCWNRPEFLHETLRNLVATGDLDTVHVVFKPDTSPHADIPQVISEYADRMPSYETRPSTTARYRLTKQSQNLLTGYQYAASLTDGLVFMVEEDIQVARDFFRFHRSAHQAHPEIFASLSTKNHNRRDLMVTSDPEAYYLSSGDYCSLGVCFHSRTIREMIVPHITTAYFRDPITYCQRTFPRSPIGNGFAEQDGLIRRIQEANPERPTLYPHVPRSFHGGFYGYNRPRFVAGDLQAKIDRVRSTIYDPDAMRAASILPAYYSDSEPVPLELPTWKTLKRKQPEP